MRAVVVVGGGAAGLTAAETLRRAGYDGDLTMVGDEAGPPYDRPPLSKQLLTGTWEPERLTLRAPDALAALGADWVTDRAVGLDLDRRRVLLDGGGSGAQVGFDGLVIATGLRAARPPWGTTPDGRLLDNVYSLRTLDDALTLRKALGEQPRLVVIGAGFIGAEVAAVARGLGCAVTLLERGPRPMTRVFGERIAGLLAQLHRDHGVDLRCEVGVRDITVDGDRATAVELTDGTSVPADVVLVGIGSALNIEWLRDSGLPLGNGVLCDQFCMAAPGIAAAGDIASWEHPRYGRMRVEHRMNAGEQGEAAARALLGERRPFAPVPYFWTDQYDVKVQTHGHRLPDTAFEVTMGDPDDGRFAGVYTGPDGSGEVGAAVSWNLPRAARSMRALIADGAPAR